MSALLRLLRPAASLLFFAATGIPQETAPSAPLPSSDLGEVRIETLDEVRVREKNLEANPPAAIEARPDPARRGAWYVPAPAASPAAHSGGGCAANLWGDPCMGIRFPEPVDVQGAYFAGQGEARLWTSGIQVIGFRGGEPVQRTAWCRGIGRAPQWMEMDLRDVDRIEILASPVLLGRGWYSLDDLSYFRRGGEGLRGSEKQVVDFDDAPAGMTLTGSRYANLEWEEGTGGWMDDPSLPGPDRARGAGMPSGAAATLAPGSIARGQDAAPKRSPPAALLAPPRVVRSFEGLATESATGWAPIAGAAGTRRLVQATDRMVAVFEKDTGRAAARIRLDAFLPGSREAPRILFDAASGRWLMLGADGGRPGRVLLALSLGGDPLGPWVKTSFQAFEDSACPRGIGILRPVADADGIYAVVFLRDSGEAAVFAFEKAPLLEETPAWGGAAVFRREALAREAEAGSEGAEDEPAPSTEPDAMRASLPVLSPGPSAGPYLLFLEEGGLLIQRIMPPLASPLLARKGRVALPPFSPPPWPSSPGSAVPLPVEGEAPPQVCFDGQRIWVLHAVESDGRSDLRWYALSPEDLEVAQWGEIEDERRYLFAPALAVNERDDAVAAFAFSGPGDYASCGITGRMLADPEGAMARPATLREGESPTSAGGSVRDPAPGTVAVVDPEEKDLFWTFQTFARGDRALSTAIAALRFDEPPLRLVPIDPIPREMKPGIVPEFRLRIENGRGTYLPGSGKIHYRYGPGPFNDAPLVFMGEGIYEALLPAVQPGDKPVFYFSAEGERGGVVRLPSSAPAETFRMDVRLLEGVMHDTFETDLGWTVQNLDVERGGWERAVPEATPAQPGRGCSQEGAMCFVTGAAGGAIGDNDLDGGPSRLVSPFLDLSGGGDWEISFNLWFRHTRQGTFNPLEVQLSNNGGATWVPVESDSPSLGWTEKRFRVSDFAEPTARVQVRFVANDCPNDDVVEAALDDFTVTRLMASPSLWADHYSISAQAGSAVNFFLDAGERFAGRRYMLLGSATPASPGFRLPGGLMLPFNWDGFTGVINAAIQFPLFQGFAGNLDEQGRAKAALFAMGPFDPRAEGHCLYFAFVVIPLPAYDFVSNALAIDVVR